MRACTVASFTKEVNWQLAKRPLKTKGRLADRQLTSLIKEAQETSFSCLSVAYSAVGSQPCRLYDTKALSVVSDWTGSADFTYYEYCGNGG